MGFDKFLHSVANYLLYLQREGGVSDRMDDGGVGKFAQKAARDKRMLGNTGMIQVKVPLPFFVVQDRATSNLLWRWETEKVSNI